MIYNEIYNFCKVRNLGTATYNGIIDYPPRVLFIIELLEKYNITYEIDTFADGVTNNMHNIYLKGNTDKWIMAHHDVANHLIDNANDNSASVINAIALKILKPEINIALVDGEEVGGIGSIHFSNKVLDGELDASWILNFELTGFGGTNFFIGNYDTELGNKIVEKFGCEKFDTPFNDAQTMIKHGLNSTVINPCSLKAGEKVLITPKKIVTPKRTYINEDILNEKDIKYISIFNDEDVKYIIEDREIHIEDGIVAKISQMDTSILYRCHSNEDHVGHIVISEMQDFVEKVVVPICEF